MQKPFQLTGVDRKLNVVVNENFFNTNPVITGRKILFKKLSTLENQGTKWKNCE